MRERVAQTRAKLPDRGEGAGDLAPRRRRDAGAHLHAAAAAGGRSPRPRSSRDDVIKPALEQVDGVAQRRRARAAPSARSTSISISRASTRSSSRRSRSSSQLRRREPHRPGRPLRRRRARDQRPHRRRAQAPSTRSANVIVATARRRIERAALRRRRRSRTATRSCARASARTASPRCRSTSSSSRARTPSPSPTRCKAKLAQDRRRRSPRGMQREPHHRPVAVHPREHPRGRDLDRLRRRDGDPRHPALHARSCARRSISSVALPTSVVVDVLRHVPAGLLAEHDDAARAVSLAIGLLIDDAVVVRENISKHLERGVSPREAALDGTQGDRAQRPRDHAHRRRRVHARSRS